MSAMTEARDTREFACNAQCRKIHAATAAGITIYAGAMAALDEDGNAANAADTSEAIVVVGRAEHTAHGGEPIVLRSGVYLYDNGGGDEEIQRKHVGSPCYVLDNRTVGIRGGTNGVFAGIVRDVDEASGEVAVEIGNATDKIVCRPIRTASDPEAASAANCGTILVLTGSVSGTNIASGSSGDVFMSNGTSWVKLN